MRYLSLRDTEAIADFIESVISYLPTDEQGDYKKLEEDVLGARPLDPEELKERLHLLGVKTWVPRRAVDLYTKTLQGAAREWQKLEESLRPATLFLISRVRRNTSALTIEEALRTGEADYAFDEDQRVEIQLLQLEIRIDLWLEAQADIAPFIDEARVELSLVQKRLNVFKAQQERMSEQAAKRELAARIEELEERLFLLGEAIPVDLLDQELAQTTVGSVSA